MFLAIMLSPAHRTSPGLRRAAKMNDAPRKRRKQMRSTEHRDAYFRFFFSRLASLFSLAVRRGFFLVSFLASCDFMVVAGVAVGRRCRGRGADALSRESLEGNSDVAPGATGWLRKPPMVASCAG